MPRKGRKQVADLLNDIFINSGLGFLSDLRMETDKTRILNAILLLRGKRNTQTGSGGTPIHI